MPHVASEPTVIRSAEAVRLSAVALDRIVEVRALQARIRFRPSEERAELLKELEAELRVRLANLGNHLAREGVEDGEVVSIKGHLFKFEATGLTMQVSIGGQMEDCQAGVARCIGKFGHDDDADGHNEVAEWAHDFALATHAG